MAHVHAFGDVAPAAKGFIHYGATSAYVTDNGDLIMMRRGLELLRAKVVRVLRALAAFAREWRAEPTLGSTHLQPAQPTTVGKRATLWMQDLVLDLADLDFRIAMLPARGVKGTTGTQASFLEIFGGDHNEEYVSSIGASHRRWGSIRRFPFQARRTHAKSTRRCSASSPGSRESNESSAATFEISNRSKKSRSRSRKSRSGSSAMAYKRNQCAASRSRHPRFVITRALSSRAIARNLTASSSSERTLDDSANRRLVLAESFLATDAILILMENIASGLEVHPARIRRRLRDELPFMATEELIVRAVRAGGDRQAAHERIRQHSIEAARAMKDGAERNDMLDRLAADPAFGVSFTDLESALDPNRFVGRAPEQVDEFLDEIVSPLLASADASQKLGVLESSAFRSLFRAVTAPASASRQSARGVHRRRRSIVARRDRSCERVRCCDERADPIQGRSAHTSHGLVAAASRRRYRASSGRVGH